MEETEEMRRFVAAVERLADAAMEVSDRWPTTDSGPDIGLDIEMPSYPEQLPTFDDLASLLADWRDALTEK